MSCFDDRRKLANFTLRSDSIGAEAALNTPAASEWVERVVKKLRVGKLMPNREKAILNRYTIDMERALGEAARVLKRGGRAVYVVGNSTIKGTFVRNSTIVTEAALRHGLKVISSHTRTLPANRRYMPPTRFCTHKRIPLLGEQ